MRRDGNAIAIQQNIESTEKKAIGQRSRAGIRNVIPHDVLTTSGLLQVKINCTELSFVTSPQPDLMGDTGDKNHTKLTIQQASYSDIYCVILCNFIPVYPVSLIYH